MRNKKIFWQIFPACVIVMVVSLGVVLFFATSQVRKLNLEQKQNHLVSMASTVSERVASLQNNQIQHYCKIIGEKTGYRITIIATDGTVLGDTEKKPHFMDNHIDREEIRQALQGNVGTKMRFSNTTKQYMLYAAVPVVDQSNNIKAVARVSVSNKSINEIVDGVTDSVINTAIATALAAAVVSLIISKRISKPLSALREGAKRFTKGELDYPLTVNGCYETASLAKSMNNMALELDKRIKAISRQQAEQNAILSSMTEAVIAVDNRKVVMMVNNAATELFDFSADSLGKSIEEAVRDPQLHKIIDTLLSGEQNTLSSDMAIFKQGRQISLQAHGTLLEIDEIRIGVLVVLRNVTQLKRLENVRKEFVANVSHELKTPITSIKGFVETLRDGAIEQKEKAAKFLDIIDRQTSRLEAIIEDLLSLSRIEQMQDKMEVEFSKTFIKPVLYGAVGVCKHKADDKNISINVFCEDEAAAKINPNLLEQAIVNLIDNAIKYSESGSKIELRGEPNGEGVLISVKDYGCGIPEDDLERIFERFYRVDKARSSQLGGTGLGLSIVKHIINVHKGTVTVKSQIGKGSTFIINLP